ARMGRGGGANRNGDRPEPPQPSGLLSDASRAVDVLQLPLAPGGHFRGVLAARGAGEHVGDDVLFLDLARLPVPRTGVAGGAAVARVLGEDRDRRIRLPHRVRLPVRRHALNVAFVHGHELAEVLLLERPADVFGGRLLVLRILHDAERARLHEVEAAGRTLGIGEVAELLGEAGVIVRIVLRHEVDAGAVQGRADGLTQKGAIAAGVVPGEAAGIAGRLPELLDEGEGLAGAGAVDHHGPAVLLDLHAAEAPHHRIGEGRRVAEGVAKRLADRQVVVLQLSADLEIL